jgi:hypothetical protein
MEQEFKAYVTSVSSSTVVLSPDNTKGVGRAPQGIGIAQITVTTTESTADQTFWGATGQCGRYEVIFRRVG